MAQITVSIAGRQYRMACDDGEEAHLQELAARLDGKITELRGHFGEIGDQRMIVMAALTIADALSESERRIATLQSEIEGLRAAEFSAGAQVEAVGDAVATTLIDAAQRIERVARGLDARSRE